MTGQENPARYGVGAVAGVRAGVLLNHPVQYYSPALRQLAGHPELRVRVYYWDAATGGVQDHEFGRHIRWKADLHSGYDWWSPPGARSFVRRCTTTLRQLKRDRPQVLLCFGWASPVARLGILFSGLTRTPLLYYGDTHPHYSSSGKHDRIRKMVLGGLFRVAAGALSTGPANREFYLKHGLGQDRIHPGVLPADVELFSAAAARPPSSDLPVEPDRPLVIGYVGKLVAWKAVDDLIEAAARLSADRPWTLWLIGDGPLRPDLERLVRERGLVDRVRFFGFKNLDELPALMSSVDILALPSHKDNRPLVVVEAMVAGAVAVVSSATGLWGPGDVLQSGETGMVFPVGDVAALTACLNRLIDNPDLRTRLATAGRAHALSFGPQEFAATAATALLATARKE